MTRDHIQTILVVVALIGAVLCFVLPMPWAGVAAAVTLLIAIPWFMTARRK